jgi:Tryptophan halogenase
MTRKIDSILIVGGGSSGWMTAAAIAKQLPDVKLTLIESPRVPTIGVGESTIGHINQYMGYIDLKDEDWMPHCSATYKTSIKFIDFREPPGEQPHTFHYPFGLFDMTDKPRGLMDWFLIKANNLDIDPSNFAEFFHDSVLMTDAVKMTKNDDSVLRGFRHSVDTAYHMDAAAFGAYLRDHICLPAGATHILDDVTGYEKSEDGDISVIHTAQSGDLVADLYIDCTGFKSLLLEQAMGVPFISFGDTLFNDRAIATVIPYLDQEREMECVTSCTAIECGWVWNIPLWHRIGTGYVYSSRFATEEEAEAQLRKHLKSNRMICPDADRADAAEFRHIKIRHGVHARAWERNVVGIGLANGFIEPLESTGLMLTHEAIIKMVNVLKMRAGKVTKFDVDLFNHAFREQIMGFKDFISQHYALTMRDDTPYWRAVTEHSFSQPTIDFEPVLYNTYPDLAHRLHRSRSFHAEMSGIVYVAAGMGYNPIDVKHSEFLDKQYFEVLGYREEVLKKWQEHRDEVLKKIADMPSHYQYLKDNIHTAR